MAKSVDQSRPDVTTRDVASWCGFTDSQAAEGPPGWLEWTRLKLGRRIVGRREFSQFFSRRLFIDYCVAVNDAFVEATAQAALNKQSDVEAKAQSEVMRESWGDAQSLRDRLTQVAKEARQLSETLKALDRHTSALLGFHYFVGSSRRRVWRWELPEMQELLVELSSDASDGANLAAKFVKSGAGKSSKSALILAVAKVLRNNGLPAEAKASGALHSLCRVALEVPELREAFGKSDDLRGSIRNALKREGETLNPFLAAMFRV